MRTDDRARRMREGSSGRKLPAGPRYLSSRGDGEEAEMGLGLFGVGQLERTCPRMRRGACGRGGHVAGAWILLPVGNGKRTCSASGFEGEMARQRLSYLLVALDWNTWLSLASRPAGQQSISCPKSTLGVLAGCHGSRQELGYPWSRSLLPVREAMCCFIPFDPFYIMGRCINFTGCLRGDMLWAVLGQVCLNARVRRFSKTKLLLAFFF